MRTAILKRCIYTALLALFTFAPATASEKAPWDSWQAGLYRDHPLIGKIWSGREKRFVAREELTEAVRKARFVLLGEIHDNPDAHRLQAWLIGVAAEQRKPAVVLEMIPRDSAKKLQDYLASPDANPAGLGAALDWKKWGWPDWKIYQPIAEAAFGLSLPLVAGDIDKPTLRKAARKGLGILDAEERKKLLLTEDLSKELADSMADELFLSHCELIPKEGLRPMGVVQRLRDAVLADNLLSAAGKDGAVLIAGNGHIRNDRAVPWYLTRRAPKAETLVVMMLEVTADAAKPEDIVPLAPDGSPTADYVWFTPQAEREDQCEALRKHFSKKKKK